MKTAPLQFPELRLNFEHAPFDQPEFRRALSRALIAASYSRPSSSARAGPRTRATPHPDAPFANRSLTTPYAPDEARRLLDGLGFLDHDGLDVLLQVEVLNLLDELRRRLGIAMLVVSHDLPVIERIADRIA